MVPSDVLMPVDELLYSQASCKSTFQCGRRVAWSLGPRDEVFVSASPPYRRSMQMRRVCEEDGFELVVLGLPP